MTAVHRGYHSGLRVWRDKLRRVYNSFEEFVGYDEIFGVVKRLGFRSAEAAWKANPLIEGSVDPRDYRKVPT